MVRMDGSKNGTEEGGGLRGFLGSSIGLDLRLIRNTSTSRRARRTQTSRRCHPRVHLRVTTTTPSIRTVRCMIDSQLVLLTATVATYYGAVCASILVPSFAVERAARRIRARGDLDATRRIPSAVIGSIHARSNADAPGSGAEPSESRRAA